MSCVVHASQLNSLDPDSERDNFKHLVRLGPMRYVELQTLAPNRGQVIHAHPSLAIPFRSIHRPDGFRRDDDERRRIEQMLAEIDGANVKLG